jgi:dTDP-4-dehydrorhamnose reductase
MVFDGATRRPYLESDLVSPINQYGLSKAGAERLVTSTLPSALVVRTSTLFGPWDEHNFVTTALQALAGGQTFRAARDVIVSPTYVPDLVNACLDLLIDAESGIWHVANVGEISCSELTELAAARVQISTGTLKICELLELALCAPRPLYRPLHSERGVLMPTLESALQRYAAERKADWITELAA